MKFKELEELRNRQQMINQHLLIAESLKNTLQVWTGLKLKEYGCEDKKKFNIDFKSGQITEINDGTK